MKNLTAFVLLGLMVFSCKENTDKDTAKVVDIKQYTIEQFMDNENAFANGFSADKSKVLMTSNRSGIYNIYTIPTEGGELVPITQSDSASVFGISYFPEDDR